MTHPQLEPLHSTMPADSSSTAYVRHGSRPVMRRAALLTLLASSSSVALAQNCIPLSDSKTCPAFKAASISTDPFLVGLYPFLAGVTSTSTFDSALSQYVTQGYVQEKYGVLLGCGNINLKNTTDYYARYTTSVICNGVVQNSKTPCALTGAATKPLCADSCAELANSEELIVGNKQLCANPGTSYVNQIRADFTNCALPADSLNGGVCIEGVENEPDNCGFSTNLQGLCNYCRGSSENATDSCCVTSDTTGRCTGVTIPVFTTMPNLFTSTSSGSPSSTGSGGASSTATGAAGAASGSVHHGLTGGAIAGIVIGSILGAALLLALLAFCCIYLRRRRNRSHQGSVFNQPSPQRHGVQQSMSYVPPSSSQQGYEVLPGGRVARFSALQGESGAEAPQIGAVAGIVGERHYNSDSDPYGDSPESKEGVQAPRAGKRDASLSSSPGLIVGDDSSPQSGSGGQYSSPDGVASGQSEQLPFFKDYYSTDDIHPNDKVSVLWAYQPRAGDEFELERGDMLKVVGIWDDGWATGIRISQRAEEYDGKHNVQRDSGVSNGSADRPPSPTPSGEIKAFPLVCVCLPEAWKKTVEGDSTTESGSGGAPGV